MSLSEDRRSLWWAAIAFFITPAAVLTVSILYLACASAPPDSPPEEPLATVAFVRELVESHEADHLTRADLEALVAEMRQDRARLVTALDEILRDQAELAAAVERLRECLRSAESCGLEP